MCRPLIGQGVTTQDDSRDEHHHEAINANVTAQLTATLLRLYFVKRQAVSTSSAFSAGLTILGKVNFHINMMKLSSIVCSSHIV